VLCLIAVPLPPGTNTFAVIIIIIIIIIIKDGSMFNGWKITASKGEDRKRIVKKEWRITETWIDSGKVKVGGTRLKLTNFMRVGANSFTRPSRCWDFDGVAW
jgi:hypothetical protein